MILDIIIGIFAVIGLIAVILIVIILNSFPSDDSDCQTESDLFEKYK